MAERRPTSELLAAYVDGIGELAVEERRRVERYLADPAARADEVATRAVIDQLRALPPEPEAHVDWAAMERAIHAEVGDDVPRRSWLQRWRFVLPAVGLAVAAAIVLLVMRARPPADDGGLPIAFVPAPVPTPEPLFEQQGDRVTVYIDGADLELALDDERLDDELDDLTFTRRELDDLPIDEASLGFLEPSDLAWIDELDDDALARAERVLDDALRHGGS